MQPINMIMIYYWDKCNGGHLKQATKRCILWARDIKLIFFNWYYISFQDMQSFFKFLIAVLKHYHRLNLSWDSFEWFCRQISRDTKYFFPFVQGILIKD